MGFRGSSYTGSSKAKSSGSKKSSSSNKTSSSGGSNQPVSSKRFYVPKQIKEKKTKKVEKTEGQKQVEAQQNKNKIQKDKDKDKQGILSAIGHGPVQKGYIGDDAFKKGIPAGQHKLRSQFDRLSAKYGPDFAKTSQGQHLLNYLSGVSVERGGGLGARDPGYGGATIDPTDPGEIYRQKLLRQMSTTGTPFGTGTDIASQLGGMDFDLARGRGIEGAQELTPDQYYNFTQQLMAADPSVGNVDYKAARKFSSGDLLGGVAQNFGPTSWIGKGIGALTRPAREAGRDLRTMVEPITSAVKPTLTDLRTDIGDMFGRPLKGLGQGISDFFKSNPPAEYMGTAADPDFLAAMRGRSIEPSDDPKTRYTGLGSYMGEEPWEGYRSPDEYRQQVSYGEGIPSLPMEDKMEKREPSLTLGYGPGDMAYTAVIPQEGHRYTYDQEGRRYQIPVGYNPLGDAFGTTYGGEQFGWRPNPWDMQPVEQTPAEGVESLAPTTIDYASMAPQFGSQYPGYKNQGLAALMERENPQLGDWYQNLNRYYT